MKDWIVPSFGFGLFIYFMLFVVLYTMKIGGPDTKLYTISERIDPPKSQEEKFLRDISENIKKGL